MGAPLVPSPPPAGPDRPGLLPRSVRYAIAVDTVVGTAAAIVTGLVLSAFSAGLSVALGFAIVIAFLGISAVAVLLADRVSPRLTLPVGLSTYALVVWIAGVLAFAFGDSGHRNGVAVGAGIVAGTLIWIVTQVVFAVAESDAARPGGPTVTGPGRPGRPGRP
jgi:ATP synthase protein I